MVEERGHIGEMAVQSSIAIRSGGAILVAVQLFWWSMNES